MISVNNSAAIRKKIGTPKSNMTVSSVKRGAGTPGSRSAMTRGKSPMGSRQGSDYEKSRDGKLTVLEALNLFELTDQVSEAENPSLASLVKKLVKPSQHRNLMVAFEQNSGDSGVQSHSTGEPTVTDLDEDMTPLANLNEVFCSTKLRATTIKSNSSNMSRNSRDQAIEEPYIYVPTGFDLCVSKLLKSVEDNLEKHLELQCVKVQEKKQNIVPLSLIRDIQKSLERLNPIVQEYLTKSSPKCIKISKVPPKIQGIHCPLEVRKQIGEVFHKLSNLLTAVNSGKLVENLDQLVVSSIRDSFEEVNLEIASLESIFEEVGQQHKLAREMSPMQNEL